jgi:hypothetical protein
MRTGRRSENGWKELYKLALLEPDRAKVPARVAEARAAISWRLSDLGSSPSSEECAALEEAQKFLRLVENKKRCQETVSPVSSYRLRGFDAVGDPTRFSKENQASSTEED